MIKVFIHHVMKMMSIMVFLWFPSFSFLCVILDRFWLNFICSPRNFSYWLMYFLFLQNELKPTSFPWFFSLDVVSLEWTPDVTSRFGDVIWFLLLFLRRHKLFWTNSCLEWRWHQMISYCWSWLWCLSCFLLDPLMMIMLLLDIFMPCFSSSLFFKSSSFLINLCHRRVSLHESWSTHHHLTWYDLNVHKPLYGCV